MRRPTFISLFFLGSSVFSFGQVSLVRNHSFESLDNCPFTATQIAFASTWGQATTGTPDLYNICAAGTWAGVPNNDRGFQQPSHGDSYAGIFTYSVNSIGGREYIHGELTVPLSAGVGYMLNFDVSLGDSSMYACDNIGAYFSDTTFFIPGMAPLQVNPQVSHSGTSLDLMNSWFTIGGYFIANGGEKYITIGNFLPDSLSNGYLSSTWSSPTAHHAAYYYIDNVVLVPFTSNSELSKDELGIENISIGNNELSFDYFGIPSSAIVVISDIHGRGLLKQDYYLNQGRLMVPVNSIPNGLYFLVVQTKNNRYVKKILKM